MKFMKLIFATLVAAMMMLGQEGVTKHSTSVQLGEKVVKRLDQSELARVWNLVKNQIPTRGSAQSSKTTTPEAGIQASQASGVMEVTGVPGGSMKVVFQTTKEIPQGAVVAFHMVMPDGTPVPLQAFQIVGAEFQPEGWNIYQELWNGNFPYAWQPGWMTFGAVVLSSGGRITYTSATVEVNARYALNGPISRADVTSDSKRIVIQGVFGGDTVATLNGVAIPISLVPTPNAYTSGNIDLDPDEGQGQMVLSVCSAGVCSTRIVYVPIGGSPGKG